MKTEEGAMEEDKWPLELHGREEAKEGKRKGRGSRRMRKRWRIQQTAKDQDVWMFERRSAVSALEYSSLSLGLHSSLFEWLDPP